MCKEMGVRTIWSDPTEKRSDGFGTRRWGTGPQGVCLYMCHVCVNGTTATTSGYTYVEMWQTIRILLEY